MSHLLENLVQFGRLLRALGIDLQAGRMLDVSRALKHVEVGRRDEFFHALRTLLVHRSEDLPIFEQAFRAFWRKPPGERTTLDLRPLGKERRFTRPRVEMPSLTANGGSSSDATKQAEVVPITLQTYSDREVLQEKDFKTMSPEELDDASRLMADLQWQPGLRRSKRWRAGAGPQVDMRALLRACTRGGAGGFRIPMRERKLRQRPLVLLCDVSGSMERYSTMLVQFAHVISGGLDRVESFYFATRLTRGSHQLRRRRLGAAFTAMSTLVPDWSGGTRIGDALRSFNVHWARRVLNHGPVVLLISDGWDRGEPDVLRHEMSRLQRSCHRLIWLNPLLGSPAYEPLTRGMQAALPFVDDFMPVHNLTSLGKLAEHLNSLANDRRRRAA